MAEVVRLIVRPWPGRWLRSWRVAAEQARVLHRRGVGWWPAIRLAVAGTALLRRREPARG